MTERIGPERVAQTFHEAYEALAPDYGYETREASAKPWRSVPQQNRELMIETARAVMYRLSLVPRPDATTLRDQIWDAVDDVLCSYRPLGAPPSQGEITDAVMDVLAEHGIRE